MNAIVIAIAAMFLMSYVTFTGSNAYETVSAPVVTSTMSQS
jgi:hypothetical protein